MSSTTVSLPYGAAAIDAILFDLDDTLVPVETPTAWQWAWRPQGPALGERRVRAAVRRSLRLWDRRRWRGVVGRDAPVGLGDLDRHLRDALGAIAGHSLPEPETEAVVRRLLHPAGEIERYPDVAPALERLRTAGVAWGIATGLPPDAAQWLVRRVGLDPARLLVTGDAPTPLPDRAAFRSAAARLGAPVERVAFVGDLFWSDARAAARAGLASILLDRHAVWPNVQGGRITDLDHLEAALAAGGTSAAPDAATADVPE